MLIESIWIRLRHDGSSSARQRSWGDGSAAAQHPGDGRTPRSEARDGVRVRQPGPAEQQARSGRTRQHVRRRRGRCAGPPHGPQGPPRRRRPGLPHRHHADRGRPLLLPWGRRRRAGPAVRLRGGRRVALDRRTAARRPLHGTGRSAGLGAPGGRRAARAQWVDGPVAGGGGRLVDRRSAPLRPLARSGPRRRAEPRPDAGRRTAPGRRHAVGGRGSEDPAEGATPVWPTGCGRNSPPGRQTNRQSPRWTPPSPC